MSKKKKIAVKTIGVLVPAAIIWWFVFGAGIPNTKYILGVRVAEDQSHKLRMKQAELEDWKKNNNEQRNDNDNNQ